MFFRKKKNPRFAGEGLFLFEKVEDAIKAEKVLKSADYMVKLVAPPPTLRKGCDLAVEINLVEQIGIERLFKQKDVDYIEAVPLKGDGELLEIVKVTDFGEAVMVKAGNMKLTFDKNTGIILNASGGGCPDIPYLHAELINKKLTDAPRPKEIGFTLCALMMDRAFVECLDLWKEAKEKQD
ncbi:MAG: DUF3343 domain-containing protein, partial [Thermodesulfobacteriota bacterium]|nr:DUF3343 domain-containing protein [Thermodesulfobacteriota bacterium]